MEMWFSEFHTPDVKHSIRVNRQLYSKQSDYQRIDIFELPGKNFCRSLTDKTNTDRKQHSCKGHLLRSFDITQNIICGFLTKPG